MKEIVGIGLLGFFIGCGGGSSSPTIGPLSEDSPLDRVTGGFIDSQSYTLITTPADGLSTRICQGGRGVLFIKNSMVTGTIIAGLGKPYVIFGTYVPETGGMTGGFKYLEQMVGNYTGVININEGSGTWSDDFGCHGSWKALKDTSQ